MTRVRGQKQAERRRAVRRFFSALLILLTGCDLAPHYRPPRYIYPNGWKGQGVLEDARPNDAASRGTWWEVFRDPELNKLETLLAENNPDLQAQAEIFTQARDVAREAEAQLYPQAGATGGMSNNRASRTRLWRTQSSASPIYMSNVFYSGAATWEPDFFDQIRNTERGQRNLAQAAAADYANLRLMLQAELASTYIGLRGLDAQIAVYRDSITYFEAAVNITRLRQAGAIAAGLDVSRAENQLHSTIAALEGVQAQREVLEHAIAVLVNRAPAAFSIAARKRDVVLPYDTVRVPQGLPSQLLERRPDIAAAERRLSSASHAIGVARAAFYPVVTFSLNGGFENNGFSLGNLANSMWSYGVQAVEPAFTGGLRRAALQQAWAQYHQYADAYRGTILSAFQDVEDGLSQTRFYDRQTKQQYEAVSAALRTQRMTMALYTGGLTNYLDVVVAQQAALTARIAAVQAQTVQLQATVRLIRALGGGWTRQSLPTMSQIDPIHPLQYDGLHQALPVDDVREGAHPASSDLTGKGP